MLPASTETRPVQFSSLPGKNLLNSSPLNNQPRLAMANLQEGPLYADNQPQDYNGANPLNVDRNPCYIADPLQVPSLNDLHSVAAVIKNTLSAAIADLKIDIRSVTARVTEIEKTTEQQSAALRHVNRKVDTNTMYFGDLHCQIEDLENRSRRHNLRVRGLPESVDYEWLSPVILGIFNDLLGRPPLTVIKMECIHRALRPKGKSTDPPRDVICHIDDFHIKEKILRNAKLRPNLTFDSFRILIFKTCQT